MQRLINDPNLVVEDMLQGYLQTHSDLVHLSPDNERVVVSNHLRAGKVGLVSGGGSGHEPCFLGYVGPGLLDAVAVGEVFSSPPASAFLDAFLKADQGAGVACLIGNYAGDTMNVKMAMQMAALQGVEVKLVVATDDLASAPKEENSRRHGIAGNLLTWKIAGALAEAGASLDEVIQMASLVVSQTRSIGVGLSPCSIPAVGHPNFQIEPGSLEYGIGHHGEPGLKVESLTDAQTIARRLVDYIACDLDLQKKDKVAMILSGMGATPLMEQYIVAKTVLEDLACRQIEVLFCQVGNVVTSLEMNGVALTLSRLNPEQQALLAHPCWSAAYTRR